MRPGVSDKYGYRGRHRKANDTSTTASTVRNVAITAGVIVAAMSGDVSPASATQNLPGEDAWHRLRVCESGENYSTNTGNGYYGAYQFDLRTWQGVGGTGLPSNASATEQDMRARALYRSRGWSPWACARILGLSESPMYGQWTVPATIRTRSNFLLGQKVGISGTAPANSLVKVYGTYYGQTRGTVMATVRTGPHGGWSAVVQPRGTVTFQAVAGGQKTAAVRTTALYQTTLNAPGTTSYNDTYTLTGKGHPGGVVTVYSKPSTWSYWQRATKVRVNGAGNWSMVWRGSTDYVFSAKGETAGPTKKTVIKPEAEAVALAAASAVPGATGLAPVSGTATPNSDVTVYSRKVGAQAWTTEKVHVDAHGAWTSKIAGPTGSYDFFAKSTNGQSSTMEKAAI